MSDSESSNLSQFVKLIFDAQHQMQDARSVYWQQRANGGVSRDVERYLHASLLQYYDALRRYRKENIIREKWEKYGISEIENIAFSSDVVERAQSGRGHSTDVVSRPARFDAQTAVQYSYRLDDLSKELGFAAPVKMQEADLDEAVV
ncbi:hypothetical protein ELS19_06165 [Halogeometricum borinquense]|uniref:Uncharacterized protein n=1 Tax=Halogeometricum borinquense TaxID=60847 RepID=A0A482T777_9EURY|nr:hypothetical protein [Halogeometricum borinquense]RYJ13580.1 hypothetical protein ELS19_06165 [Halogeometricum borinquense]